MTDINDIPQTFDPEEFDQWAEGYDEDTERAEGFPFEGYHAVMAEIIQLAKVEPGIRLLDLGTGTGSLAQRFFEMGCKVVGTDFSQEMLRIARRKAPAITFLDWDLRKPWPEELTGTFDRIVSAYVFHHFTLPRKVELIAALMDRLRIGGKIILADLSFVDRPHINRARIQYKEGWDEEEYWVVDETLPVLQQRGWQVDYRQVSNCAGIYHITPDNHV